MISDKVKLSERRTEIDSYDGRRGLYITICFRDYCDISRKGMFNKSYVESKTESDYDSEDEDENPPEWSDKLDSKKRGYTLISSYYRYTNKKEESEYFAYKREISYNHSPSIKEIMTELVKLEIDSYFNKEMMSEEDLYDKDGTKMRHYKRKYELDEYEKELYNEEENIPRNYYIGLRYNTINGTVRLMHDT